MNYELRIKNDELRMMNGVVANGQKLMAKSQQQINGTSRRG